MPRKKQKRGRQKSAGNRIGTGGEQHSAEKENRKKTASTGRCAVAPWGFLGIEKDRQRKTCNCAARARSRIFFEGLTGVSAKTTDVRAEAWERKHRVGPVTEYHLPFSKMGPISSTIVSCRCANGAARLGCAAAKELGDHRVAVYATREWLVAGGERVECLQVWGDRNRVLSRKELGRENHLVQKT